MAKEVDAEIKRMNAEGKTSREISEELAKRNIFVTWQRVRGRIAFMARKGRPKEAPQRPKDEGKTPEIQSMPIQARIGQDKPTNHQSGA